MLAAARPVAVINPAQSAAFRTQRLGRNKPDRASPQLLARCGEEPHTERRRAEPQESARLRQLMGRLKQARAERPAVAAAPTHVLPLAACPLKTDQEFDPEHRISTALGMAPGGMLPRGPVRGSVIHIVVDNVDRGCG